MKTCGKCGVPKPSSEFYSSKKTGGLQSYCKACNRLWVRKRYRANREYYRAKSVEMKQLNRQHVLDYLKTHGCVDCPETDPVVLDFDHVHGTKVRAVSDMVFATFSWTTIQKEIEKCVVRCANCHRRRTAKQFGWFKNKQG